MKKFGVVAIAFTLVVGAGTIAMVSGRPAAKASSTAQPTSPATGETRRASATVPPLTGEAWVISSKKTSDVYVVDWEEGQYHLSNISSKNMTLKRTPIPLPKARFTPDEIRFVVDSQDQIWVSTGHLFGSINPGTAAFTQVDLPALKYVRKRSSSANADSPILRDRFQQVTGMAIDTKDRIWLTRDSAHSVSMYDPASHSFSEFEAPETLSVPEVPYLDGDEILVCDALRTVSEFDSSTFHAISTETHAWQKVDAPGPAIAGAHGDVVFDGGSGTGVSMIRNAGTGRERKDLELADLEQGAPPFVALGRDGEVWYLNSGGRIVHADAQGTVRQDYDVTPVLDVQVRADHRPPRAPGANVRKTLDTRMRPTSSAVDADGNLWIVEHAGPTWEVRALTR